MTLAGSGNLLLTLKDYNQHSRQISGTPSAPRWIMAADKEEVVAQARAERRRYKRVPVSLSGRLFIPAENREARCSVTDMSPGGARIGCETVPDIGVQIVVYIDGFGRFEGTVARPVEGGFGIQFQCSQHKRDRIAEQLTLYLNGGSLDEAALRRHD